MLSQLFFYLNQLISAIDLILLLKLPKIMFNNFVKSDEKDEVFKNLKANFIKKKI